MPGISTGLSRILLRIIAILTVTAGINTTSGCGEHSEHLGVTATVQEAVEPFHAQEHLDAVLTVPVETVSVQDTYRESIFQVEKRTSEIQRFRCSRCHTTPTPLAEKTLRIAHGGIDVVHGKPDDALACFTCHSKRERDFLLSEKGEQIDLNHSHLLCGRCHFREEKDWIGGAHGKRVSNWAGPRIVNGCTACHDPHAPAIASRWPTTYSPPMEE